MTGKVIGYLRTLLTGEVLDSVPWTCRSRRCRRGPCCTPSLRKPSPMRASTRQRCPAHCTPPSTPQSVCCRWWPPATGDIGGVSTLAHPDTGLPDGVRLRRPPRRSRIRRTRPRGVRRLIGATREAVSACRCASGCPSCVQSPAYAATETNPRQGGCDRGAHADRIAHRHRLRTSAPTPTERRCGRRHSAVQ